MSLRDEHNLRINDKMEAEVFGFPTDAVASMDEWLKTVVGENRIMVLPTSTDGETLGVMILRTSKDVIKVGSLAVHESHRREGIGTLLIEYAHKVSRRLGCKFTKLWVAEGNDGAKALYAASGYKPISTEMIRKTK